MRTLSPRFFSSLTSLLLVLSTACAAPSAPVHQSAAIIPQPRQLQQTPDAPGFLLSHGIKVDFTTSRSELGRAAIRALMAAGFSVQPEEMSGDLSVKLIPAPNRETYSISITPAGIELSIASPAALPAAAQTLAQAVLQDSAGQPALPSMQLSDYPALQHRGIMLDPCRHPISVEDTRRVLSLMARYKLNRLHWHLCDDQGWRIEIKKYPRLTTVGARRPESANWLDQSIKDSTPVDFHYTQDDIRHIVSYAHSLGITIIPEIEIPGHASAAVAAYPRLGNQDSPGFAPRVETGWGVFPHVMAPCDFTFQFIRDVLAEVCELFPRAPYIHIGGDEVPRDQWQTSPAAQAFMQQHGLTRESQIQDHFTHFCAQVLRSHGRRMLGWDEILCAPHLPQDSVIMAWRSMEHARIAARRGHQVILCPIQAFYFNFPQGKNPADPFYSGLSGFDNIDWKHVLTFDTSVPGDRVIGMQANLWSECIPNMRKLEFMLVPRICALAEHAWLYASPNRPSADHFSARLQRHFPYLDSLHLNYRTDDGSPRKPGNHYCSDN
ncbi:MAG: family 20 glycosylhydrolase [Akkermansia sp.]|nr:family 20 glycosylhydrolase [Akkermansia sp.]